MLHFLVLIVIFVAPVVFSEDCKPGTCSQYETCCPTGLPGDFKCCPFENAVCCEDNTFCCPQNTQCDLITGRCNPKTSDQGTLDQLENRQGELEESLSEDCKSDVCQPGGTRCPNDVPGGYNCCPYSDGVCCEGQDFCCPENYECNMAEGVCSPKEAIVVIQKRQGIIHEEENLKMQCNDGSICNADATCCIVRGGKSACCPHKGAMCCPDKIHCCPEGQVCDITSRYCIRRAIMDESVVTETALPIDFE